MEHAGEQATELSGSKRRSSVPLPQAAVRHIKSQLVARPFANICFPGSILVHPLEVKEGAWIAILLRRRAPGFVNRPGE